MNEWPEKKSTTELCPNEQQTQQWYDEPADSFTRPVTSLQGGKTESVCIHDVSNNPDVTASTTRGSTLNQ